MFYIKTVFLASIAIIASRVFFEPPFHSVHEWSAVSALDALQTNENGVAAVAPERRLIKA